MRNPFLAAAVLAIATAAIVAILILTARGRTRRRAAGTVPADPSAGAEDRQEASPSGRRWPCPVCGAQLGPGERIRSVIRLSPKLGRIMEISGCPRCFPPLERSRRCPVCRADLERHEVLIAQVFDASRGSDKPHVHVVGCTRCRG